MSDMVARTGFLFNGFVKLTSALRFLLQTALPAALKAPRPHERSDSPQAASSRADLSLIHIWFAASYRGCRGPVYFPEAETAVLCPAAFLLYYSETVSARIKIGRASCRERVCQYV